MAVELNISRRAPGFTIFRVETMGKSKANLVLRLLVICPGVQQALAFFTKHLIVTSAGLCSGGKSKKSLRTKWGLRFRYTHITAMTLTSTTKKVLLMKDSNHWTHPICSTIQQLKCLGYFSQRKLFLGQRKEWEFKNIHLAKGYGSKILRLNTIKDKYSFMF